MTDATGTTVTRLLGELQGGSGAALDQLFPLVYEELRAIAHQRRQRWYGDETLGTTALVHEVYLKLAGQQRVNAKNRAHFSAVAATAMRQILSNYARGRRRQKRGGELRKVSLDALNLVPGDAVLSDGQADLVEVLDTVLVRLEQTDERLARVVECRFFGGMSIADTAEVLGVAPATVKRDWALARAWLFREMQHVAGA